MTTLNWLLAGAGDIARKRVAQALAQTPGSRIAAVCDPRTDLAGAIAAEHGGAAVFGDYAEALASSDAEAVYLATPVWLHAEQAVAALEAGRHVLVEKPLGLSGAEAQRVVDAARASGRTAGCAYFRRCFPRYLHAKEMLDAGEFGQIVLVRMCYFSWFSPAADDPKRWRVVRAQSGGGPLSDMGSHMFDVLIGLFGLPKTVFARCANLVHDWEVEDAAAFVMTLANGAQVTGSFHWNSKTWRHEFEVVGTEAKVCWLPCDAGPVVKTVGREVSELPLDSAANVHAPLVEDFVAAIRDGRAPACPVEEAALTNRLLDAVYESAETGKEVAL